MKTFKIIFCFIFSYIYAYSDSGFSVSLIPDSLKKDAHGVVRFSKIEFDCKSEKSGVEKHSYAVTVLNKNGKELGDFMAYGDKFRELKKFSAKLYNANGDLLRKFKMSDLRTTRISEHLASDNVYHYFYCETPVFPFTIHYEYEINWKNGIFSFPVFYPQTNYSLAVERADYQLNIPVGLQIHHKALNGMTEAPAVETEKERKKYTWQVDNLKTIEPESFSPPVKDMVPVLFVHPENFIYDKVNGIITDWESYGKWMYGLQAGREVLPEEFRKKIISMTQEASTDYEKVKILYDYLGETTRYVSIQLGIGGFQPMYAAEVNRMGFGDCKALSFYLKSMLEVIDIPSNYVEIRSDRRNKTILKDYASFYETNHAILQVPLQNDTLWLECTNPKLPFGYVHNSIAGHDAVEIKQSGGKICRLPDYPDSLNIDKTIIKITLNPDGSTTVESQHEYHLKVYDNYFGLINKKENEQKDVLRRKINLPHAVINQLYLTENKTSNPYLKINSTWETDLYGTKTGNRLFLPVNPLRTEYSWFKKKERKYDIDFWQGFNDIDSISITFPEEYEIESIPMPVFIETKYGIFKTIVIPHENEIIILQSFYLPAGKYNVSEYNEIRELFNKLNSAYNSKIILRRKVV